MGIGAQNAWRRLLEALAERGPLVLVFEDLHWADEGLLDFVDHLVEWAAGVPILVLGTARPELLARREGWGGGKPNAVTLSLSPLDEEQTARLVHALLEQAVLPAEVQSLLLERAGGNPLYAEEFARIAAQRGLGHGRQEELPLPESVQGLIAARLDGLPDLHKALIQDAAVVGKVFWLGAVAALGGADGAFVLQERLHALERREFVRRERRSSVAGETQFAFSHGLVREVAYGQIPRAERAQKHRRAAEWIEALGRPEDHAEMLAHHYVNALEAARAAGQTLDGLAEAARLVLRDAGDRAAALSAFPAAARYYSKALELWPEDDAERPKLLFHTAEAHFQLTFENENELVVARDALLAAGDYETAAEAEVMLTNVTWIQGRGDDTLRHLERAAELAAELPPSASKAYVLAGLARFHMLADRDELAEPFVAEALELAQQLDLTSVRASVLNTRGTMRASVGDEAGLDDLEESIALHEEVHSPEVTRAYNNLGFSLLRMGDVRRSSEVAVEGVRAAERFGVGEWVRWARDKMLYAYFYDGRWDEALNASAELLAEVADSGHYLASSWQTLRGHILLARGDEAGAVESATIAIEQARIASDLQVVAPALVWRARVLAATGQRDMAEDAMKEFVELLATRSPSASIWFPDAVAALLELGRPDDVERLAGLVSTSTRWLVAGRAQAGPDPAKAAELYAEMGARPDEADARLHAARGLVEGGRRAEADAQLRRALAFYGRVGAVRYAREAETLLAASA